MSKKITIKKNKNIKFSTFLEEKLKDYNFCLAFLQAALEEYFEFGDKNAFLSAIKKVISSQYGVTEFCKKTGLSRASFYKMLSENGNPTLDNLNLVLTNIGLKFNLAKI